MQSANFSLRTYQDFIDFWNDPAQRQTSLDAYTSGECSFILQLLPEQAVQLSAETTLDILCQRFGKTKVDIALSHHDLDATLPDELCGPVADQPDGEWLRATNMVGINVRTVGNFWNVVKYALTLPDAQNSIHLLPIWEPGVVGSMYGISSWNLNSEFYSEELAETVPELDTIEKQLRVVVNLLHLMGKNVGMDVIPHTDRLSQIALAFPEYFEWLQRQETLILDHSADLHKAVQHRIMDFLHKNGAAVPGDLIPDDLFSLAEDQRMRLLFGLPKDREGRDTRRNQIIEHLMLYGFEPFPATMAPPFRGLKVDTRPEARHLDAEGRIWRDFAIIKPEPMSRVFGPLGRYKLYESKDNNANWELDFERPYRASWDYVCEKYASVQRSFGFDFMRGDMSHVQMRPQGVPAEPDPYYDILGAVKIHIQAHGAPYFGYFAESFLGPRDVFGYGEEMDHLEAAQAETTLGDLQSTVVGSPEFLQRFRTYHDLLETRRCAPNFTVMTSDKDDPRFDEFYIGGNEVRLFIALFLTSMPSYMGLGFETRDTHHESAPNEHYTKLYVFQESEGPKATHGPYTWGKNGLLFSNITRLRTYAENIFSAIQACPTRWLIPPDACAYNKIVAWTQREKPEYVFIANTDINNSSGKFGIPQLVGASNPVNLRATFSTTPIALNLAYLPFNGKHYIVNNLAAGEGRVYRIES